MNPGTEKAAFGYQNLRVSEPDFIFESSDVDVAVIQIPKHVLPTIRDDSVVSPCSFDLNYIAADEEISKRFAGEPVVFIGFPDHSPVHRIETHEYHYPLLRQGVVAYPPVHGVEVEGELGSNYGLLDSYAQSGFSGAPIIALQKGWADGTWHSKESHRPPSRLLKKSSH